MKLKTFIFALLIGCSISACKKDTTDPNTSSSSTNTTNNNNNTQSGSVLCNGKNTNTYLPIKTNNSWTYSGSMGGSTNKITDTVTYDGKLYTIQKVTSSLTGDSYNDYFRVDANGDIYEYVKVDSKEYMFLPASPTVGNEWPTRMPFGVGKRKVISLTATIKTSNCEYKDLLEVHDFDPDGSLNTKYYYKKGLGLVSSFTFSSTNLTAVTLN